MAPATLTPPTGSVPVLDFDALLAEGESGEDDRELLAGLDGL